MGCVCIYVLLKKKKKTEPGPEESGIKTPRPLLTALQCGEPPGLWSGSLKLRSEGFGLHPSSCTQHKSQSITLPSALLLRLSASGGELKERQRSWDVGRKGKKNEMKAVFDLTFFLPEEEPLSPGH